MKQNSKFLVIGIMHLVAGILLIINVFLSDRVGYIIAIAGLLLLLSAIFNIRKHLQKQESNG
ncbi:MAG: hypothetical protein AAF849_09570 [Bacteroidota bacterium]